ncbi:Glutamate--tRNA ligase [Sebaldella termitidis]|jgi:glutamyl-tRNA synthetase|uniref:Glutamate--tRNA ligase n=1 Tax=Sebaldella termitidis (strain ATCC 33386 / NCTC 11300) TaxID=526218 RepID=D1AQD5_SEBTE|nr:glutamate--tRNA ligase [Sebaldella termitidis]ACZ10195.1 glutamyl-tRNA synthetase [Sebaldella termitidis ATCC 33386]MBP7979058.1 glutamate--tRNA ligase [Sebaldella sp.]SUI25533.1 Glutamate--tRNA ligase [Sebaldella termitidis]
MEGKRVRVRIAPSPTGDPHVGTAYIGLFNYAFAKKNNGDFLLRIEDTDRTRFSADSEQQIFDAMHWLGLNYDEGPDVGGAKGPYRQSERFHIYKEYAEKLVEKGEAYYCFCTPERLSKLRERQIAMKQAPGYDRHCRNLTDEEVKQKLAEGVSYVIRLKMPYEGDTVVHDELRGDIVFENSKIDDQVLLKSDGFPTYHLANIVDDYLMEITHVIRAEEWIASTPKHIQLYKAFGWEEPKWYHMPLLRNADKSKISKRKNPVSLNYYVEEGYLKEGLLNFLALMGWSFGGDKEIFSLEEMIENFSFDRISLGGPVFDLVKLGWVNNQHMKLKDLKELTKLALPYFVKAGYYENEDLSDEEFTKLMRIVEIGRESAQTLKELPEKSVIYYEDDFELPNSEEAENKKERKSIEKLRSSMETEIGKKAIDLFVNKISMLNEKISEEEAIKILNELQEELGEGPAAVLMPIRAVLTGKARGADLYTVIGIIGKERTLGRVKKTKEKYNL